MAKALAGPRAGEAVAVLDRSGLTAYEKLDKLFTPPSGMNRPSPACGVSDISGGRSTTTTSRESARAPRAQRTGKHSCEIRYVFGKPGAREDYDEIDARVSDTMQHAWSEFARTGTPSSPDGSFGPATRTEHRGSPTWTRPHRSGRSSPRS